MDPIMDYYTPYSLRAHKIIIIHNESGEKNLINFYDVNRNALHNIHRCPILRFLEAYLRCF